MRSSFVALALATLVVVAATALFTQADEPAATPAEPPGAASWDATVTSFDGTVLALTIYRPEGASAANPVPVVFHSHGWSGTRIADGSGLAGRLWREGFGVVTIDARGHGDSGGFATVHHKDAEVKDFIAILDFAHDTLDWVQKEPGTGVAKDIVAGGAGYSYAGAFQLQTATHDARLDALAPEITWADLPYALAPEHVVKSVWVDFLYGIAKQSGTRIDPRIDDWYWSAMATNELPAPALAHFRGSNPAPERIHADVLLIQGIPDVLFNLNQALMNHERLSHGGNDVRLFTHLTGHVLPYAQPLATTPARHNVFLDKGPCGSNEEIVVQWMDEKLRGNVGAADGIAKISYALENGECLRLDALPTETLVAEWPAALAPSVGGSLLVPLASGPLVVAGVPTLEATVDAAGAPGIAHASLVVVSAEGFTRVVDDQATPFRASPGVDLAFDLAGVATRLEPGDELFLRVDGLNEWFVHNSARMPGGAILHDIKVTLPVVA